MCNKYNGWTNYETWIVKLWLDNSGTGECPVEPTASAIKDYIQEFNPLAGDASMYADMLGAALSSVNWYEIAEAYIEDN